MEKMRELFSHLNEGKGNAITVERSILKFPDKTPENSLQITPEKYASRMIVNFRSLPWTINSFLQPYSIRIGIKGI